MICKEFIGGTWKRVGGLLTYTRNGLGVIEVLNTSCEIWPH